MSAASWAELVEALAMSADWYVATTASAVGHWDEPALGEWTVRDLVGHTSRSLLTIETYLDKGAVRADVTAAADYFQLVAAVAGAPAAVAQRGRDAAVALGADIPAAVAAIAGRVVRRVRAGGADDLAGTPVGGMRLADYLPTRVFELTVHTCDLAAALRLKAEVPPLPAAHSTMLIGELAARGGLSAPLLLAATGRGPLPAGFSVLGAL